MQITTKEYCEHVGWSNQRLNYRLRKGLHCPGIVGFKVMGKTFVLEVLENWKEFTVKNLQD